MNRPAVLYRYRGIHDDMQNGEVVHRLEREVDAILQSRIHCSRYSKLNDPMEGYYEAAFTEPNAREAVRAFKEEKSYYGIASFSETHDNELMWVHYAGNYSGICVEYQYDLLSESLHERPDCILRPITYSNQLLEMSDDDMLHRREAVQRILLQKKLSWSYELEWRLIGGLGFHDLLPGTVSKIFFGARIDRRTRRELMRRVSRMTNEVEFQQMQVNGYSHVWSEMSPA